MTPLFAGLKPTVILLVVAGAAPGGDGSAAHPFATIAACAAHLAPGLGCGARTGDYPEAVKLPSRKGGTPAAPWWLLSLDGPGKARILVPPGGQAGIEGLGVHDVVVQDFEIVGGTLAGVQFSQSGLDFSYPVARIAIRGNYIHGGAQDAIKVSQGDQIEVTGNRTDDTGQQGVDLVDVVGAIVKGNDCARARTAACYFAKNGSQAADFIGNTAHDLKGDVVGFSGGGWGGNGSTRPLDRASWNSHGLAFQQNRTWNTEAGGLIFLGCDSCAAALNVFDVTGIKAFWAISASPDDLGRLSKQLTVHFNTVVGVSAARAWGLAKGQDAARDHIAAGAP